MTFADHIAQILDWKIKFGHKPVVFTVGELIVFLVLICVAFLVASIVRKLFHSRILARTGMSPALQKAVARFAGYVVLFIGLYLSFQTLGIDLSNLAFLAGALGLGLGFGLQNIISNFVSGLIILFERPIVVGDRIDVGGVEGDVTEINARSTKIITNDNITIIVPNSEFISSRVINWSHGDPKVRFRIPVGVSYGSDPGLVEKALLEVADDLDDVLKDPAPAVRFMSFGDSSLNFELRVWTESLVHQKNKLISEINFGIFKRFQRYGIEIPFPQRDVHIKEMPVPTPPLSPQDAAAAHLRETRLFRALGDEGLGQLVQNGQRRRFHPQQTVVRQGDPGDSLFIVLNGVVTLQMQRSDGSKVLLPHIGRGDYFGEGSFLTGEKRRVTATAETTVEVFEMNKECMQAILEKDPEIARELSQALAAREERFKAQVQPGQTDAPKESSAATDAHSVLKRIEHFFRLK